MNLKQIRALGALIFFSGFAFGGFAATNSTTGRPAENAIMPRQMMRTGFNQITELVDAVVVDEGPMVHTAQILPWGPGGDIVGKGDAGQQVDQVLKNLLTTLKRAGVLSGSIVKINVYVTQPDVVPLVKGAMMGKLNDFGRVALDFVTGNLTNPDALVAVDAVAISDTTQKGVRRFRATGMPALKGAASAILPGGAKYYVSGQAKDGALPEATSNTLASISDTLAFLGLGKSNVVQLKAFVQPISEAASVQAQITEFFSPELPPPVVFVEASSPTNMPIEIEFIAADSKPAVTSGASVDYLTPPGATVSKVFSRVARVNYGRMVYFSGLYGNTAEPAAAQLNDIYIYLDYLLPRMGTDFDHLVKATYYVTDDDASKKLNDIRPKFYNPDRPPAASKVMVKGVGFPERSVMVDMIGVTR